MSLELYKTLDTFIFNSDKQVMLSEGVSLKHHCLWTGYQAIKNGNCAEIVLAALLHDVGHFLLSSDGDMTAYEKDLLHADVGAKWLSNWLPPSVVKLVEMHVLAKRYLYTCDSKYKEQLLGASLTSLHNQGLELTAFEVCEFEKSEYFNAVILVRKYDDQIYSGEPLPEFSIFQPFFMEFE